MGEPSAARTYYAKVEKSSDVQQEDGNPDSTSFLARQRMAAMGGKVASAYVGDK
jgi:hypothetical protein